MFLSKLKRSEMHVIICHVTSYKMHEEKHLPNRKNINFFVIGYLQSLIISCTAHFKMFFCLCNTIFL